MKEIRDPEVRLFGMNIAFQVVSRRESESQSESIDCADVVSGEDNWLEDQRVNRVEEEAKKDSETGNSPVNPLNSEPSTNPETVSDPRESPGTPSVDEETENDANDSQRKTLKKPDKILPCPRCKSMDTKFCYYNNYNVNQPRHFCKSCQRYWTSGGSMRNVAVGAGRRKNKNSASHCRLNGTHHSGFGTNGQILSFGSDARLCESMASANGIHHRHENGRLVACNGGENGDDCSSKSSVTTSNSTEEVVKSGNRDPTMANSEGFFPQIQYLQGVPWPWSSTIPMPPFCPQGFPMSFYPPPYWNCNVQGTWSTVPWLSINKESGSNFSTNLGKRSREGDLLNATNPEGKESVEGKSSEGSILVPKTLRFDDPIDAAKSSIWTTLGIKNESTNNGGIFRAFQAKGNEKLQMVGPSPVLLANPAAFSRSVCFRESS